MTIPLLRPSALRVLALTCSCGLVGSVRAAERDASNPSPPAANSSDAGKTDNPLHLTAEKRKAAGIVVAHPTAVTLAPQIEAFGRVIDPAPLVSLIAEDAVAQASLAASEKEEARVKGLFQNGANASAQAVEAAEANVAKDRASADSARLRLIASWGHDFAEPARVAALREAMTAGAVLARIDVLPGNNPSMPVKSVEVQLAGSKATAGAEVLGPAPVVDPQVQGGGLLVLIREGAFPVGAALRATLPSAGESLPAFVVPRSALVYHNGSAWVYVLGENDTFERKLVAVQRDVEGGVALANGLEAGDQVVTTGAEELLAAELQTADTGE